MPAGFAAKFDMDMEWERKRGLDCNCKVFGMSHWKDIYKFLEIKIPGRNIDNFWYADDVTLMAESEELKSLSIKVKEESEKVDLKLNIQKTKIMASGSSTSWQIDRETVETVADFIFSLQNHCRWWLQPWN